MFDTLRPTSDDPAAACCAKQVVAGNKADRRITAASTVARVNPPFHQRILQDDI
jgi:hypothetical protein